MKQAVPDRWSVPMPGRAPGIVQLPPPLVPPGIPPSPTPPRGGPSPLVVAALALVSGIGGAIGVLVLFLAMGMTDGASDRSDRGGEPVVEGLLADIATGSPVPAMAPIGTLVVDVAGGVMQPGLRTLRIGERVGDAVAAAGGFAPRADLAETSRTVNLAEPLTDGMKVLVPELGADTGPSAREPADTDARVDLNGASQVELESLPGIGPVTAQRIIASREEQRFGTIDDLRDRGVVGQAVFEDIRELVRVEGG